jgi:DNA processing protein
MPTDNPRSSLPEREHISSNAEAAAAYLIASARGVGPAAFHHIAAVNASTGRGFMNFLGLSRADRTREYRLPRRQLDALSEMPGLEAVRRRLNAMRRRGIRLALSVDSTYPSRLRDILGTRAPAYLFLRGDASLLSDTCDAVVGTRRPTRWGARGADEVARAIVEAGHTVVSGYAEGVDLIAHHAAIETGGHTILVLRYGMDHYQPTEPLAAAEREGRVAVVSQFPPDERFSAGTAMARNRVIAAMAERVVAIESARRGGTMRTARMALELGCSLFTLRKASARATPAGNRQLLEEGACPLMAPTGKTTAGSGMPIVDCAPLWDASPTQNRLGQTRLAL